MDFRFKISLSIFVILFFLIIARLFYWQVFRADELQTLAQAQYGQEVSIPATRGEIKTSDNFSIVANKLSYLVFANPKEVKDKNDLADKLAPLLQNENPDINDASISAKILPDRYWVPIQSNIDNDTKQKIQALNLPGIGFEEESGRLYPEASVAAKLLGFVGKDDQGNDKGYFGIEGFYDRQLKGKKGLAMIIHDANGQPILSKLNDNSGKVDGRTLVLHIDRTIQFILDNTLKKGIDQYGASRGVGAVMDPKTGAILAMSGFPSFDPANFGQYTEDDFRNPFINDTYEPGSTFKPLIMASAINSNLVKPDTKCSICAGPISIGGYEIHTWDDKYFPNTTMTDVIVHSDNTGMTYVGEKLGLDRMISYLKKFGFDNATGIDLQGEEVVGIRPKEDWYPIDLATASFGQGIVVTPIQLLTAFSAIANNGKMMEPHVVADIQTPDGQTINIPPKVLGQPISDTTAHIVTEMMVDAVDNGEAKFARLKGYRIAGKTGTAQIPVAGHYDPTKTIASFIGFAPADDPKFLMLIIINRPTASIYGAETAAPIFFNVAKNILTYYGIPPSE